INEAFKENFKINTCIIYFDFNDFKPFNDIYGFRQGDRAILMFAELLQKRYQKNAFIAHIGGDDFFVGIKNSLSNDIIELTSLVQDEFENSARNLYSKEDKEKSHIVSKDRFGTIRKFDLLTVSSAIIEINPKSNIDKLDHMLNIVKTQSKGSRNPIFIEL
ncbi:MAG TPA: diguanylate cyclase, partial [Aliarcobacter thereius]